MSDSAPAPEPPRRGNEMLFFGFIVILVVAVFGGAAYVLNTLRTSDSSAPGADPTVGISTRAQTSPHGAAGSRAAALAVVEKYFRLALSGQHKAACALESPAYRKFDARNYRQGSCEAASRAGEQGLAARGLSLKMISAKVGSFTPGEATIVLRLSVGSKHVTSNDYVQYHGDRWWITGSDDSGDLGYE